MRRTAFLGLTALALMLAPGGDRGPTAVAAPPEPGPEAPKSGAPAPPVLSRTDAEAWLDGLVPYALRRGDIAGAVVVIVRDGEIVLQKGYGHADRATGRPVDPRATLFRIGSITKLFTWTAVMQLVQEGRLDLDADVNGYLDFDIAPRPEGPVTLRALMTHRAGFEEVFGGMITGGEGPPPPLSQAVSRWVPERIFAPGTTPAYSNYGTALAGRIVERVSGLPIDEYLERRILAPLDMAHTTFRQPLPPRLRPFMSRGYQLGSATPRPFEVIALAPAGSATSTGADMARFMIAHLEAGGPILRPATARRMHGTGVATLTPLNRMALGFYEQGINGRDVIGHGGDTQWFHSHVWLFPQSKTGLFVAMNSTGRDNAAGILRTALFQQFADRYLPPERPGPRRGIAPVVAAEHAHLVAGTYLTSRRPQSSFLKALEPFGQLRVAVDPDGGLLITGRPGLNGGPRKWVETAPFVWREANGHGAMAAEVVDGSVRRIAFSENAPHTVYERTPWHRSSAWWIPSLLASLAVLASTALAWPVGWAVRRRYGVVPSETGETLRRRRLVMASSALAVAVLAGWTATMAAMFSNFALMNGGLDWLIRLLQVASILAFPGLFGVAFHHLVHTWREPKSWSARIWSLCVVAAAAVLLWYAAAYNLLDPGTGY